jgi:hypothetical protein
VPGIDPLWGARARSGRGRRLVGRRVAVRPQAGRYLPSTPGASKHQVTALPTRQRMGMARRASTT